MDEWTSIGLMCGPTTVHKLYELLHVKSMLKRWEIGHNLYKRMFNL